MQMTIFLAIVGLAALFMAIFLAALCWDDHCAKHHRPTRLSDALRLRSYRRTPRPPSVTKIATLPGPRERSSAAVFVLPSKARVARKNASAAGRRQRKGDEDVSRHGTR